MKLQCVMMKYGMLYEVQYVLTVMFQAEVSQHVVSQQLELCVVRLASFPSASFVKVKSAAHHTHTVCSCVSVFRSNPADVCLSGQREQQSGSVLVGKVMIPCARGAEQTHCLVLSQQQLQRVHRLLMT